MSNNTFTIEKKEDKNGGYLATRCGIFVRHTWGNVSTIQCGELGLIVTLSTMVSQHIIGLEQYLYPVMADKCAGGGDQRTMIEFDTPWTLTFEGDAGYRKE